MVDILIMVRKKTKNKILIVIESPGKQRTIEKYLKDSDEEYLVRASFGHVMELSDKRYNGLGVDITPGSNYRMCKTLIPKQKDKLQVILDAATDCKEILIATDPDREGEAIAQDLYECLESVGVPIYRISFGEITKNAILNALKNKHEINHNLVSAQKCRMAIDKITGYLASPWLRTAFQSVQNAEKKQVYSAGRVQSPAVRLIIDREEEIEKFIPEEYWNIFATLTKNDAENKFQAKYNKKILNKNDANKVKLDLEGDDFTIINIEAKEKKKNPFPPLITSSLQQAAGAKFGLSADLTMKIAQNLYERGYISYMRTDSVRSSPESIEELRNYLKNNNYSIPIKPNLFTAKSNAQDGHEAIRVTDIGKDPEDIFFEDQNHKKIYKLIWERFVASQMEPAIFDTVTVLIKSSSGHELKANGKTLKSSGWLAITQDQDEDDDITLPDLKIGDKLNLITPKVKCEQKFTQPLPRYSEGALIKELEKKGIGRPSTFATIVTKIKDRDYVELKNKTYHGTDIGKKVIEKLKKHFKFIDYDYTLLMEEKLDLVADGKLSYEDAVDDFYKLFEKELKIAYQHRSDEGKTDILCNKCKQYNFIIMHGQYGFYLSCGGKHIIDCKNTVSCTIIDGKPVIKDNREVYDGITCPKCSGPMTKRDGKFGPYLACLDISCKGNSKVPYGKRCPKCGNHLYQTIYQEQNVLFCMGYPNCYHREDLKNEALNPNKYSKIDDVPKKIKKIFKAAKTIK